MESTGTNILIVEDIPGKQQDALDGISAACGEENVELILEDETQLEIANFRIKVVGYLRDANLWIEENKNKDLITILDGCFPFQKGGQENENYFNVLLRLCDREGKNFIIPYSSGEIINKDMGDDVSYFKEEQGKKIQTLSEGGKDIESVQQGIQEYLSYVKKTLAKG